MTLSKSTLYKSHDKDCIILCILVLTRTLIWIRPNNAVLQNIVKNHCCYLNNIMSLLLFESHLSFLSYSRSKHTLNRTFSKLETTDWACLSHQTQWLFKPMMFVYKTRINETNFCTYPDCYFVNRCCLNNVLSNSSLKCQNISFTVRTTTSLWKARQFSSALVLSSLVCSQLFCGLFITVTLRSCHVVNKRVSFMFVLSRAKLN